MIITLIRLKYLFFVYIFIITVVNIYPQTPIWVDTYNTSSNLDDEGRKIAIDRAGNIICAGYVTFSGSKGNARSYLIIKYNQSGSRLWTLVTGSSGSSSTLNDLKIDTFNNIYVTGSVLQSSTYTVKISSGGTIIWSRNHNSTGGRTLALDKIGNLYIASIVGNRYCIIKYNNNGNFIWERINGSGNFDNPEEIVCDDSLNVYVTGQIGVTYGTIKYDSAGTLKWNKTYYGGTNDSWASSLKVDKAGNTFVTGTSYASGTYYDIATLKYNSTGDQVWVKRYTGIGGNAEDVGYKLIIDDSSNVYVTGFTWRGISFDDDYVTVKYDSSGNQIWVSTYNGTANKRDVSVDLTLDRFNNVFVTGLTNYELGYQTDNFTTIKYSFSGNLIWAATYNGPSNLIDRGASIITDSIGDVYVTGTSKGNSTNLDYITLKYSTITGIITNTTVPSKFSLSQNYPNPFNPTTKIRFDVSGISVAHTFLTVYDILGREVATLLNQQLTPGTYEVEWNGSGFASGIYYYKLTSGSYSETKKMLMVK